MKTRVFNDEPNKDTVCKYLSKSGQMANILSKTTEREREYKGTLSMELCWNFGGMTGIPIMPGRESGICVLIERCYCSSPFPSSKKTARLLAVLAPLPDGAYMNRYMETCNIVPQLRNRERGYR